MKAISVLVGIVLLVLGLSIPAAHPTPFLIGVGLALGICGATALSAARRLQRARHVTGLEESRVSRDGLVSWWRTPKLYPNGSSFTGREIFFFQCLCWTLIALGVWLMGWSLQAVCDSIGHAWRASQAK